MGFWDLFGKEKKSKEAENEKRKGDNYFQEGSYMEAVESYQAALEKAPHDSKAHYALGCTYYRLGEYKKAVQSFQNALEFDPDNSRYYNEMGKAYLGNRSLASAVESFLKAVQLDPHDHMSLFGIGTAYREDGNYEQAANYFLKALQLNPGDLDYQKALEEVTSSLETPDQATDELEKPEVLFNQALSYLRTDFRKGVELLQRVVKIKPDFAEAFYYLGISCVQLHQHRQALEYCQRAVQLQPDDVNYNKILADVERIVRLQEQAGESTLEIRKKLGEKPPIRK